MQSSLGVDDIDLQVQNERLGQLLAEHVNCQSLMHRCGSTQAQMLMAWQRASSGAASCLRTPGCTGLPYMPSPLLSRPAGLPVRRIACTSPLSLLALVMLLRCIKQVYCSHKNSHHKTNYFEPCAPERTHKCSLKCTRI